jgi:hypothetical protein
MRNSDPPKTITVEEVIEAWKLERVISRIKSSN